MNYGEARDRALQFINQYSIAGTKIASSYNNQEDYILRIPGLVNDAQMIIASGPRRMEESVLLDPRDAADMGSMYRYTLPEDLMDFVPGGLLVMSDDGPGNFTGYTTLGEDYILVPKTLKSGAYLRYYRRPQFLDPKPLDTAPLDNVALAQEPIPYFVAAELVMRDDAFAYATLYNIWLDRLGTIGRLPRPERQLVQDVYGWGGSNG